MITVEGSKPKINITAEWNELLKEVLQLRPLKEENEKLKKDIVDYVLEKDDEIEKLKKENVELIDRVNEIDSDVNRNLQDQLFTLKNDYAVLKAQKHPMYPLHWMGLDPLIHEQAKDLTIEETIDKVRKKTSWVEEPVDWKGNTIEKPWKCPCNKCKEVKKGTSWEEAASDLALRVVKLEKQIKELTLIKVCQKQP